MNKNLLIVLALCTLAISTLSAQTFQLQGTNYIGALTADAAADWTKTWTNFDPKNAVYGDPTDTTTLNGMISTLVIPGEKEITTTVTLDATKVYLLKGIIVVRSGGKLVIPAGTVIRALADLSTTPKNYATIVVERGAKIEITGTVSKPVVITSAKAAGARDRGDWGGLLIAGKAPHNLLDGTTNNNVQMEGFNGVTFDANLAKFGGTDAADNSGIVSYLRLEFGGLAFEVNKEINGLTLGAVGSGTTLNNIQVSYSGDDSFEWFGGNVNSKYLIAYKGTDDDFDTDNGYKGINQFGIAVRDSAYYDLTWNISGGSTSEAFESDNEATGTANVSPYTAAVFSNFTLVGPIPVGSSYAASNSVTQGAFRRGARIRRNSSLRIVNSIFMGYRNFVMLDGDSCIRNTNDPTLLGLITPNTAVDAASRQLMFSNNIIVNTTAAFTPTTSTASGLVELTSTATQAKLDGVTAWVKSATNANKIDPVAFTTGTLLVNPSAYSTTPDFRPVAGSPALSGGGGKFIGTPIASLISGAKEVAEAAKSAPVFPNPISKGNLNFGHTVEVFGVFDMTGKMVGSGFNEDHFNVQNLSAGMYFIKMEGQIQKFIVQ